MARSDLLLTMVTPRSKRRRYQAFVPFLYRSAIAGVVALGFVLFFLQPSIINNNNNNNNSAVITTATETFSKVLEPQTAFSQPHHKLSAPFHGQPLSRPGKDGQECRHEGHCGIGTTCGVDTTSSMGGRCKSYYSTRSSKTSNINNQSPCVTSCLRDLRYEEYARYPSQVVLTSTHETFGVGRPYGCVLVYERHEMISTSLLQSPEPYKWPEFTFHSYMNATLSQRVVRMDPVLNAGRSSNMWMAMCYEPCETTCTKGFVCSKNKVCIRDEAYWTPTPELQNDMVIVSGASDRYIFGLMNLASSMLYWAPNHKLVVYNLGFSKEDLQTIESWSNVLEVKWRDGIPQHYPEHVRTELREYAWKPIAMNESLHEYRSIFWLDAGSTLVGPIDEVIRITRQTGIYLVKGQDNDMMPLASAATFRYYGYEKDSFRGGPHYSGNTQAYLYPSKYVETIVIPNAACAQDRSCIAPKGEDLTSHRYDQTSLSILAYRHEDMLIPAYTHHLAAGRDQLNENLENVTYREGGITHFIMWTSRSTCSSFASKGLLATPSRFEREE